MLASFLNFKPTMNMHNFFYYSTNKLYDIFFNCGFKIAKTNSLKNVCAYISQINNKNTIISF